MIKIQKRFVDKIFKVIKRIQQVNLVITFSDKAFIPGPKNGKRFGALKMLDQCQILSDTFKLQPDRSVTWSYDNVGSASAIQRDWLFSAFVLREDLLISFMLNILKDEMSACFFLCHLISLFTINCFCTFLQIIIIDFCYLFLLLRGWGQFTFNQNFS